MKDILQSLTQKQKIIMLSLALSAIIVTFIGLHKYFYQGKSVDEINTEETNEAIVESDEDSADGIETNDESEDSQGNSAGYSGSTSSRIGLTKQEEKIIVHVVGQVNKPGVVTLPQGARIKDAIEQAGGASENADLSKINLAYMLEDGTQIYVPSFEETSKADSDNTEREYISSSPGENVISDSAIQETSKVSKVNINTATLEQLETLPGVGESTAKKIIEYREKNGKFQKEEDLKNVSGIGDAKYAKIQEYIKVK